MNQRISRRGLNRRAVPITALLGLLAWPIAGAAQPTAAPAAAAAPATPAATTVAAPAAVATPVPGDDKPGGEAHLVPGKELPGATAGKRAVVRERHQGIGGMVELLVATDRDAEARQAIGEAFAEIARIEKLTSDADPASDVAKINQAAGTAQPVPISPELLQVLEIAKRVSDLSGGAFDVTWASLRGMWKFTGPPPHAVPSEEDLLGRVQLIDYRELVLTQEPPTARLTKKGAAVGLGGIAKGYAVDRAAKILRGRGFTDFIVYAGGDLYTSGEKAPGKPWTVGMQHPRVPGALAAVFPAPGGSIVTSGDYEEFFVQDGVRYHHIIDTRTGMPAGKTMAVTVLSPEAAMADAVCTAIFVLGPEKGLELAKKAGVEAIVIDPKGQPHLTDGLAGKVKVEAIKP